ncbi:hypothetical protein JYU29_12295 [Tianweitania sp. BSSL-BM11]|uniref:DUF6894 domain-containing protein n=1 Tax=Tianweitania aestuarii TaxID=2814886 RepID=A0ABS5RWL2_9HYPH|nr:hypothetical protein [Tianweitania aestuarii]MBS9721465.1 hypothetical protein [Tianweitania aestuarii]
MMRYFFDLRDGDSLLVDNSGLELASFDAAKMEASDRLTEFVKLAVTDDTRRATAIEIRAGDRLIFTFKIIIEAKAAERLRIELGAQS